MPLILALIFYLGVAVALFRVKRAEYALLLIWLVWMWVPSILSDDAPSIRRMIGSLPAVTILIALGMGWLLRCRSEPGRETVGRSETLPFAVTALALSGLLIYTSIWSYQYLFVDWGRDANMFHIFDVGLVDIGKYAAATPADTRLYYTPAGERSVTHLTVTWQVRDRDLRTFRRPTWAGVGPARSGPCPLHGHGVPGGSTVAACTARDLSYGPRDPHGLQRLWGAAFIGLHGGREHQTFPAHTD